MGKKAQRRRVAAGKAKGGRPDDRHDDYPTAMIPTPEMTLQSMLAASRPDAAGRRPHEYTMALVFSLPGGEDEAHRLAAMRDSDPEAFQAWMPPDGAEFLRVTGPECISCHKIRGPLAPATLCGERRPNWVDQRELEQDLRFMPRHQRRELVLQRRRLVRRELQKRIDAELGQSPMEMAKAAVVQRHPTDEARPVDVKLTGPDAWPPERVVFAA
jgi:hypothetical protein